MPRGTLSAVVIVLLNLSPLAGLLWFGWDAGVLLLLYWAENVVVGVLALCRIVVSGALQGFGGLMMTAIIGPFFVLHYGAFCAAHLLILAILLQTYTMDSVQSGAVFTEALWPLRSPGALWSLASLTILHLAGFAAWLLRGDGRRSGPQDEMGRPYARIILLHMAVLIGALGVMSLGQPLWAVAMLVALKTTVDLLTERRAAKVRARREAPT